MIHRVIFLPGIQSRSTLNLEAELQTTLAFPRDFLVRGNDSPIHASCPSSHRPKVNQPSLVTLKERGSANIAEKLPVRRTVTVVVGSNLVL